MKLALSAALLAVTLLATTHARADGAAAPFGGRGQMAVSADRLFGYNHISQTTSFGGADRTTTGSSFSLFSNPLVSLGTAYSFPRLVLDGFIADRVSLGGSVGISHFSSQAAGSTTSSSTTVFMLMPRLGFAATLSDKLALWPHAGLTYLTAFGSSDSTSTLYALSLDAPLVFSIGPHVGILAGLTADIGLGGESKSTTAGITAKVDRKATEYGVQFGLVGYL